MTVLWATHFQDADLDAGDDLNKIFNTFNATVQGGPSTDPSGGRWGLGAMRISGANRFVTADIGTTANVLFINMPVKINTVPGSTNPFFRVFDAVGALQASLSLASDFRLVLKDSGGSTVATSMEQLVQSAWHHLEIKFDTTNNQVSLRLDRGPGQTDEVFTNASVTMNALRSFECRGLFSDVGSTRIEWDHIIAFDDQGSDVNDWIGDCRMFVTRPVADDSVAWTPSTGADNYALVDETPLNEADYVETDTDEAVDMYVFGDDFPADDIDIVHFAFVNAHLTKEAGGATVALRLDSDGNVDEGDPITTLSTGRYYQHFLETDPDGGGAWTVAQLNAIKAGVKHYD